MAVYREGYKFVEMIEKKTSRVFNDAFDIGAPVIKGDPIWKMLQYVVKMYGIEESRAQDECGVYINIKLVDEWAVSDGRKTMEQATEKYEIRYMPLKKWKNKPYLNSQFREATGFVNIVRHPEKGRFHVV